jgi:hypothetical protein
MSGWNATRLTAWKVCPTVHIDPKYVRETVRTRYASRNFRNQLLLCHRSELPGCEWSEFQEFLHRWLPVASIAFPRKLVMMGDYSAGA